MATSADQILVPAWSATLLLAAFGELVHAAWTARLMPSDLSLYVAAGWSDGQLVVALASRGRFRAPVPSCSGAAALLRAGRIACEIGGDLVRGIDDDGMLFGLTFDWPMSGDDDSVPF